MNRLNLDNLKSNNNKEAAFLDLNEMMSDGEKSPPNAGNEFAFRHMLDNKALF